MKRRLLPAILVTASTVTYAQTSYDFAEVRQIHAKFGQCVVKKRHDAARRFLLEHATELTADRERLKLISVLADGDCLLEASRATSDVEMKLPGDTMRYALAEAMIRTDLSRLRPTSFANVPRLTQPKLDGSEFALKPHERARASRLVELEKKRAEAEISIFLANFGECVARTNPVVARSLLDTAVGSTDEAKVFSALNETLGSCIGVDGKFRLNKSNTRGTIAMNYYRLASASLSSTAPSP